MTLVACLVDPILLHLLRFDVLGMFLLVHYDLNGIHVFSDPCYTTQNLYRSASRHLVRVPCEMQIAVRIDPLVLPILLLSKNK